MKQKKRKRARERIIWLAPLDSRASNADNVRACPGTAEIIHRSVRGASQTAVHRAAFSQRPYQPLCRKRRCSFRLLLLNYLRRLLVSLERDLETGLEALDRRGLVLAVGWGDQIGDEVLEQF